jgi:hypothetical protein
MDISRNWDLIRGYLEILLRHSVMDYPQIGIECARPISKSVAKACVCSKRFVWVVVAALMDEYLELLQDISHRHEIVLAKDIHSLV